jgi:signal transduction histidine kinase
VTVTTDLDANAVMVIVADTGPGIAGDPERIFERFTRSADSGGTGLGLTIARQLVELHGGSLTAANEPTGGARFTVTFPRP